MSARWAVAIALLWPGVAGAADRLNILDYAPAGTHVDRGGGADASQALANAVAAANVFTAKGEPACVYVPPGVYRIVTPPPAFARAGCVVGDGSSQSTLSIDPRFEGDLFAWSEAWVVTTPGPRVVGLTVRGSKTATKIQNALMFYDRNDQVYLEDIDVDDLHGRVLYSGVMKNSTTAYMRESHIRALRFFDDGTPTTPVVEFSSEGNGQSDATNEIRISQIDIFGANGPSFVIRNNGTNGVRNITVDMLRIEGLQDGSTMADLLTIGDPTFRGNVNNITFTNLELIDPAPGHAALRMTSALGSSVPYQISVTGTIGGGVPAGQGLRVDAGRASQFHFSAVHTFDTNVVIGRDVNGLLIDGGGQEGGWTYSIDSRSVSAIHSPVLRSGNPSNFK